MAEAGVVTNKESSISVADLVNSQPDGEKSRITVVTSENFDQYVDDQLGLTKEEGPEQKAAKELKKVEAEKAEREAKKAAEEDPTAELDLPKDKKGRLNERFSELTKAKKEAEAKAAKVAEDAKVVREAKEAAERQVAELKAKYEPVKTEPDPEPLPSQFTDVNEYSKALKEWTADNTRREDAKKAQDERAKQEAANVVKAWSERQAEVRKETADYDAVISGSEVKVSDQVRDAILESEVGPKILYHLAKNPDVADKIGELTIGKALKEIGRLEAKFADGAPKKEAKAEAKNPVAEISSAPAPISPLRNADAPVVRLSGNDDVPQNMTYEDWKKLRVAGKIK